jgi:acetyl-CoA carboxylase biotin carboxylase subunit
MKVLIANRGEIALRIIRACHDLNISTVAVYSEVDEKSLHVLTADEAVCIGKAHPLESYLKIPAILSACEITGADAIHPGYGFLSENANFASICESCGIKFIGPNHLTISLLGNKAKAKEIAKKAKCPIIYGSDGVILDVKKALKIAKKIGFPIYIKASAGGGGRGIRIAVSEEDFFKKFVAAQAEAGVSFNNSDVYLEKVISDPRHVEIQIIADEHGNYVYLPERDCSLQRRKQKLIEEAPSPIITPNLRKKMGIAAVNIAKEAKYSSVGTVEFLVDEKKNFYFMEMNTRIQVEHPITEEITGIDLIKEQIKIAMGEKLSFKQKEVSFNGHSIEFRINAEDSENNFAPSPGVLDYYFVPGGPNVRIDSGCYSGYKIEPYYDSLIAKLIVKGKDRNDAIAIAKRALKEFHIVGIKSTIGFYLKLLEDKKFLKNDYSINYIDDLLKKNKK